MQDGAGRGGQGAVERGGAVSERTGRGGVEVHELALVHCAPSLRKVCCAVQMRWLGTHEVLPLGQRGSTSNLSERKRNNSFLR